MRRVNWTVTEQQHRALKRISQETGLPISELVRRAIDKYVGLLGEEVSSATSSSRSPDPRRDHGEA